LSIAGQAFQHGLGTHAHSKIVYGIARTIREVVIRNVPNLINAEELKAEAFYPAEEKPTEINIQKTSILIVL
jgi:hypothetical protein